MEISYPVRLKIFRVNRTSEYKIPRDTNVAVFDADKIKFPLTVRHWKEGDRFIPFGMKGSRKLVIISEIKIYIISETKNMFCSKKMKLFG